MSGADPGMQFWRAVRIGDVVTVRLDDVTAMLRMWADVVAEGTDVTAEMLYGYADYLDCDGMTVEAVTL